MKSSIDEDLVKNIFEGFVFEPLKYRPFEALQGETFRLTCCLNGRFEKKNIWNSKSFYLIQRNTWKSNGSKDMQSSNMARSRDS